MLKPLKNQPLYQIVVHEVINQIKSGNWEPGAKVPGEEELCRTFEVSRNSVREGLKSLQILGVIESRAGAGTKISEDALRKIHNTELINLISDGSSIIELMELRMIIEPQLAFLASKRANEKDKERLRDFIHNIENKDAEEEQVKEKGFDFHMLIAEIAQNKFAVKLLTSLTEELSIQRDFLIYNQVNLQDNSKEHIHICEAILNRNPENARDLMYNHIEQAIEFIKKNI
ncbi:FadR/GntR family transcriptional regulator [Pontibacillus salicampi]|uniref:FadR/GntR family transcriptional regulator n=1 Tax=Pontibacillus salicampi TaxID=1449801 RepID=A0ABV6LQJ9_9BACI